MSVGSIAVFTQATGVALPLDADGFAAFDFGTETSDADNIFTRTAAGVYRADVAGRFLVIAEALTLDTSNGRFNPALRILDDSSTFIPGSLISGYSRNNANDVSSPGAHAVIDMSLNDTFTVQDGKSVTDDPTGNYINGARLIIVQLDDTAALLHIGTPTSSAHGGTTRSIVAGWDVITETDATVIELNADGQTIDLKSQNTGYLVLGSLHNSDVGGNRTRRTGDITQASSIVGNLVGGAISRNNANEWGTVALRGAVVTGGAASTLTVGLRHTDWGAATPWGTLVDGSWVLSTADSGLWVVEVPLAALSIFADSTGLETISGSTDTLFSFFRDTTSLGTNVTRNSNTQAEVDVAGDYLVMAAMNGIEDTPGANLRMSNGLRVVWEAVNQVGNVQFTRALQGSQDDPSGGWRAVHAEIGAAAADTIEIQKYSPSDITNYGTDAASIADRVGVVIVDLALLAPGGQTIAVGTLAATDTPVAVQPVKVAPIGTSIGADSLVSIAAVKPIVVSVGTLAEANALNPAAALKVVSVGTLPEIDTLNSITAVKPIVMPVGVLAETEPLVSVGGLKTVDVGTLVEADSLLAVPAVKPIITPVGALAEIDGLTGIAGTKTAQVGTLIEVNTLNPISAITVASIGTLAESDLLHPIQGLKIILVGTLAEANTLLAVPVVQGGGQDIAVTILAEIDALVAVALSVAHLDASTDIFIRIVLLSSGPGGLQLTQPITLTALGTPSVLSDHVTKIYHPARRILRR